MYAMSMRAHSVPLENSAWDEILLMCLVLCIEWDQSIAYGL